MKIQLDTIKKTIKLDNNVKLSEMVDILEKLLPNGEWKSFTLESSDVTINNWTTPYIIEKIKEVPTHPYQKYPWYYGNDKDNIMLCSENTQVINPAQLKEGNYNIEVNN